MELHLFFMGIWAAVLLTVAFIIIRKIENGE